MSLMRHCTSKTATFVVVALLVALSALVANFTWAFANFTW
jgi:hypothetical protein